MRAARMQACAAQAREASAVCGRAGAVRTARQHLVLQKAVELVEQKHDENGELVPLGLRDALLGVRARAGGASVVRLRGRFGRVGAQLVRK